MIEIGSFIGLAAMTESEITIKNCRVDMLGLIPDVFKKLGINLQFGEKKPNKKHDYCMSISTGADLSFEGKKLIGSAQFRKEGYILQHGSILFDYNKDLIEKLFGEKTDENSLTCMKNINPKIDCNDLINVLKNL
jgi:lipoate-protein ligase A